MTPTDTSEAGLKTLICRPLTGSDYAPRPAGTPGVVREITGYARNRRFRFDPYLRVFEKPEV